jgi:hypothetical protein
MGSLGNGFANSGSDFSFNNLTVVNRLAVPGLGAFNVLLANDAFIDNASLNILYVENDAFFNSNVYIEEDLHVEGNTYLNGNLFVKDDSDFGGNVNVEKNLNVNGDELLNGNLTVAGNTLLQGTLEVVQNATFDSEVEVLGNAVVERNLLVVGTLNVDSATYLNDQLFVRNNARFNSNVYVQDTLSACNIDLRNGCDLDVTNGNVYVNGNVNFNANVDVNGPMNVFGGPLNVYGDELITGNLEVRGTGGLLVSGGPTVTRQLNVSEGFSLQVLAGDAIVNGSVDVALLSNLHGGVRVENGLSVVSGASVFSGPVQANAGLTVTGGSFAVVGGTSASSFAGPVTMGNTLSVAGGTTLSSLSVASGATIGTLAVVGGSSFGGSATVAGTVFAGAATVTGALTASTISGTTSITSPSASFGTVTAGVVGVSGSVQVAGGGAVVVGAGGSVQTPLLAATDAQVSGTLVSGAAAVLQGTTTIGESGTLALRGTTDIQTHFSAMAYRSDTRSIPVNDWTAIDLAGFVFNPLGTASSPGYSLNGANDLVISGMPLFDVWARVAFDNGAPNASSGKVRALRLRRSDDGGVSFSTVAQTTAPTFQDEVQIVELNTSIYNSGASATIVLRLQAYQDTNSPSVDVDLVAVDGYSVLLYVKGVYCPSPIPNNP